MKKDYHCQKNIFHRQNSPKMEYEINNMGVKKWQQIQSKNEEVFHFTYDIDIFILYIKNKS